MARLKAKVNEKWITGDNAQQLVNNALAAHHIPICGQNFRDYANHFIALYKAQGSVAQSTLGIKNHILPILPTSAKRFAAITLYTGMRRGKICALRWEDVDLPPIACM